MSHRTRTTVDHWFDLTEAEQFERQYRDKPDRILRAHVSVVDGSVHSVRLYGRAVLKSGGLGSIEREQRLWRPYPDNVKAILAAHGIGGAV